MIPLPPVRSTNVRDMRARQTDPELCQSLRYATVVGTWTLALLLFPGRSAVDAATQRPFPLTAMCFAGGQGGVVKGEAAQKQPSPPDHGVTSLSPTKIPRGLGTAPLRFQAEWSDGQAMKLFLVYIFSC